MSSYYSEAVRFPHGLYTTFIVPINRVSIGVDGVCVVFVALSLFFDLSSMLNVLLYFWIVVGQCTNAAPRV